MVQHETIRSIVHDFLKNRDASASLFGGNISVLRENERGAALSMVINGAKSSYRLITVVEAEEKGYLINFIVELLDPKSLAGEIKDKGAEFFSTMVVRLNEPLPGSPFIFDPKHPSLLCSALADELLDEAVTEDLLKELYAAIHYLVRQYERYYDALLLEKVGKPYPEGFKCKQCGHCCMNLDAHSMSVPQKDVDRWREAGRYDILEWVESIPIGNGEFVHDIWLSPVTGEDVKRCPWLRKLPKKDKYICRIQDLKPTVCRVFPQSRKHAEECRCKGFEDTT
ncbi:MAG TPA: YkgJ family cysteine cluster protein [Syntrophobacteraceae bacterium]|nr:YkgJ family cysteine cluster protein [Syntrophobacteraceae bacterium]